MVLSENSSGFLGACEWIGRCMSSQTLVPSPEEVQAWGMPLRGKPGQNLGGTNTHAGAENAAHLAATGLEQQARKRARLDYPLQGLHDNLGPGYPLHATPTHHSSGIPAYAGMHAPALMAGMQQPAWRPHDTPHAGMHAPAWSALPQQAQGERWQPEEGTGTSGGGRQAGFPATAIHNQQLEPGSSGAAAHVPAGAVLGPSSSSRPQGHRHLLPVDPHGPLPASSWKQVGGSSGLEGSWQQGGGPPGLQQPMQDCPLPAAVPVSRWAAGPARLADLSRSPLAPPPYNPPRVPAAVSRWAGVRPTEDAHASHTSHCTQASSGWAANRPNPASNTRSPSPAYASSRAHRRTPANSMLPLLSPSPAPCQSFHQQPQPQSQRLAQPLPQPQLSAPQQPSSRIGHSRPGRQLTSLLQRLEAGVGGAEEDEEGGAGGGGGEARWAWLGAGRRDGEGRAPCDPLYDPTTLFVPEAALREMSNFNRQFWQLKRQAMDLVLFVRHGSFYNLFDVDADVGMRCGLALSGARRTNMWKCGCTKDAFPAWASKVLALGYSVGRVEEAGRGQGAVQGAGGGKVGFQGGGGGKGGVQGGGCGDILQRRLVKVYTPGMTGLDAAEGCDGQDSAPGMRPMVALCEAPGGRIGVALLHAGLGQVLLGEMQDNPSRTHLHTLLMRHQPAEVVAPHAGLAPASTCVLSRHARGSSTGQARAGGAAAALGALGAGSGVGGTGAVRPLLVPLPANSFARAASGFVPCTHAGGSSRGDGVMRMRGVEAGIGAAGALAHCDLLLHKVDIQGLQGQGNEEEVGPQALRHALRQLAVDQPLAVQAAAVLLQHLSRCHVLTEALRSVVVMPLDAAQGPSGAPCGHMQLDSAALVTLEILEGSLGSVEGSLMQSLDHTSCVMGRRKLRQWLCRPLLDIQAVEERLQVTELLMRSPELRQQWQGSLTRLPDLQRLMPRAAHALDALTGHMGQGAEDDMPGAEEEEIGPVWVLAARKSSLASLYRLLAGLLAALEAMYTLRTDVETHCPAALRLPLLQRAMAAAEAVLPTLERLLQVFDTDGFENQEGDEVVIKRGACPEYDAASDQLSQAHEAAQEIVQSLTTALATLGAAQGPLKRVRAVGAAGQVRAPVSLETVMRKVDGVSIQRAGGNGLLVTVPQLVAADAQVQALQLRCDQLVSQAVCEAAACYRQSYTRLAALLDSVASLDVLAAFATSTCPDNAPEGCTFSRPVLVHAPTASAATAPPPAPPGGQQQQLDDSPASGQQLQLDGPPASGQQLQLDGLWHPTLAAASGTGDKVVPNNVRLGGHAAHPLILLLTGANMGGKSTLLRAVAVATIMSQLGCYVPASTASLTPVDSVFTRMGAHDRIMAGESTFMVEMAETAVGLASATPASLVVLDELGRGTATHDGYAIAYAVLQRLGAVTGARTLFATHHHGLTRELSLLPYMSLGHMAHVTTQAGEFVPLHLLRPGPALEGSSGIAVAGLAGLARPLLSRAQQCSAVLAARMQRGGAEGQMSHFDTMLGTGGGPDALATPSCGADGVMLGAGGVVHPGPPSQRADDIMLGSRGADEPAGAPGGGAAASEKALLGRHEGQLGWGEDQEGMGHGGGVGHGGGTGQGEELGWEERVALGRAVRDLRGVRRSGLLGPAVLQRCVQGARRAVVERLQQQA